MVAVDEAGKQQATDQMGEPRFGRAIDRCKEAMMFAQVVRQFRIAPLPGLFAGVAGIFHQVAKHSGDSVGVLRAFIRQRW